MAPDPTQVEGGSSKRHTRPRLILLLVAGLVALASVFFLQLRGGNGSRAPGSAATTQTEDVAAPEVAPTQLDFQAVADRVSLQSSDLGEEWAAFSTRARAESVASYDAVTECEPFVPVIRGDSEIAIAGRDTIFFDGTTAVTVVVIFYDNETTATAYGPDLLLDSDYQQCVRRKIEFAVEGTNEGIVDLTTASRPISAPNYGQRTVAIRHVAEFTSQTMPRQAQFTDEWSLQIGRAVLGIQWSSESEHDSRELELVRVLGQRFQQELAATDG